MTVMSWQEHDLADIAALEQEAMRDPWSFAQLASALASGNLGWVVRAQGTLAAYAIVLAAGEEWELLRLAVASSWRRQGVASGLLAHFACCAEERGARRLLLEVRASNEAALACYRRAGYREIARRRGYYSAPEGREDAVVMAKEIEAAGLTRAS